MPWIILNTEAPTVNFRVPSSILGPHFATKGSWSRWDLAILQLAL